MAENKMSRQGGEVSGKLGDIEFDFSEIKNKFLIRFPIVENELGTSAEMKTYISDLIHILNGMLDLLKMIRK